MRTLAEKKADSDGDVGTQAQSAAGLKYVCVNLCLWRQRKGWLCVTLILVVIGCVAFGYILLIGGGGAQDSNLFDKLDRNGDKELSSAEVNAGVKAGLLQASGAMTSPRSEAFLAAPSADTVGSVPVTAAHSPSSGLKARRNIKTNPPDEIPPDPSLLEGGIVPPVKLPDPTTPLHLVISAFRDGARCARTMGFALQKAKFPERIHFRVMQAIGASGDISCAETFGKKELPAYCNKQHRSKAKRRECAADVVTRVKIWTIPLEEGMGPAHQRGLLNEHLDFDDPHAFCMTTDSHMDFRPQFDELVIEDWLRANNEFAVLTTYPMAMMRNQDMVFDHSHVDLCGYRMEDGIPRGQRGGNLHTREGDKPYFSPNWAAGFSFHRCHADRNVPVDKNLKFIFTGEEVSRAVRFWTNGYDLYQPTKTDVYHDYSAAKQDFWNYGGGDSSRLRERAKKRVRTLLKLGEHFTEEQTRRLEPFGLGTQRTIEAYVEWSRIDMNTANWKRFMASKGLKPRSDQYGEESEHDFCQKLKRVPVADVQALRASVFRGGPARTEEIPDPVIITLEDEGEDEGDGVVDYTYSYYYEFA